MKSAKMTAFRPRIETMEARCLLAAGVSTRIADVVHQDAVVNLAPTQAGADFLRAVSNSAPHTARQKIVVRTLTADSAAGTVSGTAIGLYKITVIGSIDATIQFKTSLARPRPGDVKVSLDRFNSFLKSSDRLKIQRAVVTFLRQDHDLIAAQFPTG